MPPEKIHGRNEKGQPVCNAKLRNKNRKCRSTAVMRNGRCRLHGGATPVGPDHGAWKNGKYSKAFSTTNQKMAESYERFINDPDAISLRNELGVVDARIAQLIEQHEFKGSGILISQLREQYNWMRTCLRKNDPAAANMAVARMGDLFDEAYVESLTWGEIAGLFDLRRKLVREERERLVAAQNMVTADELAGFMGRVATVLGQKIKDPGLLSEIAAELRREQRVVNPRVSELVG